MLRVPIQNFANVFHLTGNLPGTYDPIPKPPQDGEGKPFKDIKLDSVRAKYWLGVGAQPSDPAWRLLSMVC
jgi:ribosomal protein S16